MTKSLQRKLGLAMVLFGFAAVTVHSVEARRQAETPLPQLPYLSTHFGCLAENDAIDGNFAAAVRHIDDAVAYVRTLPNYHAGDGRILMCARDYHLYHHPEKAAALLEPIIRQGGPAGEEAREELTFDAHRLHPYIIPSKAIGTYLKKESKCQ